MRSPHDRTHDASRRVVLVVMCTGYYLVLLDVTVINVALPSVGAGLGASTAGLQWVVAAYSVSLAALLLTGATVGDLVGHRRVVLTGLGIFAAASALCGAAPTVGVLVAGRVAQGLGAALLLPGTLAIIADQFTDRAAQARAIGVWAGVGSTALAAGPLLGGVLVQTAGWRWVFWLNVPIVLVTSLVTVRTVPRSVPSRAGRVDRAGCLLATLTLGALTFAIVSFGQSPDVLVPGATLAVAALGAVAWWHAERRAADPMLPLSLLRRPTFVVANGVAGIMNLGTLGLLFLLTQYLQTVQGRGALLAGVATLPLFVPLSLISPVGGRTTGRLGARVVMITGLVLAAAGIASMLLWEADTTVPVLLPGLLVWGVGLGVLTPAVVAAAVAAAPADRSGVASGVNNTARQAGGALGIATFGVVAGSPDRADAFVDGLHASVVITVALFALAAVATALAVGRPADD